MPSITRTALTDWLVERVAYYVERDPAEIDPTRQLTIYGMDSVYTLGLAGDIEEEFGVPVDPTVAWDNPTIEAIADYVLGATGRD
ncbi:acyl carrier protein [Micromonospora sp. NPDC049559]|uniref:acyl carrier protein n=1 Tax=Micromonospora sp. NPDC049559 TaxID=3155923 RepID=UPI00343B7ED7